MVKPRQRLTDHRKASEGDPSIGRPPCARDGFAFFTAVMNAGGYKTQRSQPLSPGAFTDPPVKVKSNKEPENAQPGEMLPETLLGSEDLSNGGREPAHTGQ